MKIKQFTVTLAAAFIAAAISFPTTCSADEWVKTDNGYKYEYTDGSYAEKGWLKIGKDTYYIQKDGTRKSGWLKTKSGNYYFGSDGKMYKSKWLKFKSGDRYYLTNNGKAAAGVVKIGEISYKFDSSGKCQGENYTFTVNTETMCLHGDKTCRAAKNIDAKNKKTVNIGADELADYSKDGYWACGVSGCNSKAIKDKLPKKKK